MIIGKYELFPVETGRFGLDGGAMFGVVPRTLWEKSNPPDEKNRIAMVARALLLVGDGRKILIDTGNGSKFAEKFASIYKIDNSQDTLLGSLQALAIRPEDVTDVILTHLHFDHAGGATTRMDAEIRPTFPRATYYVQHEHWKAAMEPTDRDRASFIRDDFLPLKECGVLEFTEGEGEILPGITSRVVHGHTSALQCPVISEGNTTLLYCADLVPLSSHLQLPWIMAYDLRPLVTLEEKRRLLGVASDEQWTLFFEHDPVTVAARVIRTDRGFSLGTTVPMGNGAAPLRPEQRDAAREMLP
jgi:glyoxylase-like metal-dependent hydrolase (beta-lactamase superfamily II)